MAVKTIATSDELLAALPFADGVYKGRLVKKDGSGALPFAKLEVSSLGTKYYILYAADGSEGDHTWNSKAEFYNAIGQVMDNGSTLEIESVTPAASTEGDKKKTTTSTTDMTSSSMSPMLLVGLAVLLLIILKKK